MNKIKFTFVSLLCIGLLFQACDKNEETVLSNIEQGNHKSEKDLMDDYCKRKFTIKDFPDSKVFKKMSDIQGMGKKKESAIVSLLFDKEGILYTPVRYNSEAQNQDVEIEVYLTDLKTFHEVTKFPYAISKYVKEPMNGVYLFDAYQKFYKENSLRTTTRSSSNNCYIYELQPTDLIYTSDSRTGFILHINHGHVGVVVKNNTNQCPGKMKDIEVIEAIEKKGVVKSYMGNWWSSRSNISRLVYTGSMSDSERNQIVSFLHRKVGERFYTYFELAEEATSGTAPMYMLDNQRWYCSKLVWHAYGSVLGVDIDSDGGATIWPNDIRNSGYFREEILEYWFI